jgi:hypothetical protein
MLDLSMAPAPVDLNLDFVGDWSIYRARNYWLGLRMGQLKLCVPQFIQDQPNDGSNSKVAG